MRRSIRVISVTVCAGVVALAPVVSSAAPAGAPAGDAASAAAEYLLTPPDLRGDYGRLVDFYVSDFGRGAIPSTCNPITAGVQPDGKAAPETTFSNLEYPRGLMWQSSVFQYRSVTAARASFEQLRDRSVARCTGEAYSPYGDDEAFVPNVNANSARVLPATDGMARFAVASSHILLEPEQAPGGYTDAYWFGVWTLVDNAIVQVQTFSPAPLSGATRAEVVRVATRVSARYAATR